MGLGQSVRLASVRCLTLPSRRKDSRRRIHGGELRLATVSMYMAIKRAQIDIKSKIKIHIYMATYLCQKTRESSIEAIQRTIAQSKFRLAIAMFIEVLFFLRAFLFLSNRANEELFIACMCLARGIQNGALHKTNGSSVH